MNFTASDNNPVLVAPRPVRISSAPHSISVTSRTHNVRLVSDHLDKMRVNEDIENDRPKSSSPADPPTDKDVSPRASPRSTLPSEALEEFLSILKPSFFAPTSPILRTRRHATSLPTFSYELPYPYKSTRSRIEFVSPKDDMNLAVEELERVLSAGAPTHSPDSVNLNDKDGGAASPISRMQTRNPFQRHPSYEVALAGLLPSPRTSPIFYSSSPISPATIPLPLPTPDEVIEVL